ncbi:MAG: 1-(5-phosphoribosyl)-5-[(5-phosphoribosylamino)methylideneamino]imidazole-4-carboxamide isomerase [Planctomycetia bacterium]|nr:1-(5-phosphoribosyl)-5-[(5-phosphoribosylamino)methylideneamino]imidazole-4-carboxamide isomerase [Planctomycetia bacterium]
MEIIPAIDLRGGKCVRLKQGDYARETVFGDDPAEMALRWTREGAARLHLVDLDGAKAGRPVNVDAIRAIVRAAGVLCQLGGGLRDEAAMRLMLEDVGIDRVIVGTQALKAPEWFREMAEKFPRRLVLGIDACNSMVATEGWLDVSHTPALDLARGYARLPIAAIIYTNIANDGMMSGVDPGTIDDLCQMSDLGAPVIASGGVTTAADVVNLVRAAQSHPNLTGAIVGRALYEGTLTLADALAAAQSPPLSKGG